VSISAARTLRGGYLSIDVGEPHRAKPGAAALLLRLGLTSRCAALAFDDCLR
jgi:hypothetical protein